MGNSKGIVKSIEVGPTDAAKYLNEICVQRLGKGYHMIEPSRLNNRAKCR